MEVAPGEDETQAALDAFGIKPPTPYVPDGEEEDDAEYFKVWPENWPTVELFLMVCTQWNMGAMGGYIGLKYEAVDIVMKRRNIIDTDGEIFDGLQEMERAALKALNEKRAS